MLIVFQDAALEAVNEGIAEAVFYIGIGWIPALIFRFAYWKRPLTKPVALAASAGIWLIFLLLLQDRFGLVAAIAIGSFSWLIIPLSAREIRQHEPGKSKRKRASSPEYILCSACGFEQWQGYKNCQKCGDHLV